MEWFRANRLRPLAVACILVWLVSLALPAYVEALDYVPGDTMAQSTRAYTPGILYLLVGWSFWLPGAVQVPTSALVPSDALTLFPASKIGVTVFRFAWFANPLLAWSAVRMLRGLEPHWPVAIFAALLSIAALQPFTSNIGDPHGVNSAAVPTVGIYMWAIAAIIPLLATGWRLLRK